MFCNQRTISGVREFDPEDVKKNIDEALNTISADDEVEIAFFGGSFTGIDRDLMIKLLKIGHAYIEDGRVKSIRCSTRPDYIDTEIIDLLKKYGVSTVELGLQSTSDKVLGLSKRGHYFEAERNACELIVKSGINLGGQMMIGLPGSDVDSELETARFIISSGASEARIYPTVVFRETELCDMTLKGEYTPLELEDAISRSALVLNLFLEAGVEVIRIGLQANENLSNESSYLAGPNHPALGELVIGELYYNKIKKILEEAGTFREENISVVVSRGSLSKVTGQNKRNKKRLTEKYPKIRFAESDRVSGYEILIETQNGEYRCT
ncbi:MAG: radical SAM protein [Clostridia bacterium]|nr:radical SAM protein [Clostridia bacterium]